MSFSIGERRILDAVSAELPPGQVTGLLGPNGAGKSTLLRLIAGIEKPNTGSVDLDGSRVSELRRRESSQRIALLEQSASPGVDLRVLDVVLLGRIPHRTGLFGGFSGDEDRLIVTESLTRVGIADLTDRSWHSLSGGQQQRVQIARALAQQPQLLLLDEPTNHLDVNAQLSLLSQVRELGFTTVAALHDLNLAATYCDHLLLLQEGRLVAAGPPAEVLTPATIAAAYGVDCDVIPHPRGGHPLIVFAPVGRSTSTPPAPRAGSRVFQTRAGARFSPNDMVSTREQRNGMERQR
nr:ABC transporter ATP-binding protein [Leifsonia psychrotolerans]